MSGNTVAIITARYYSSRLPGKVLKPLCGRPMLEWVIKRTQSSLVDKVVVATEYSSTPVIDYCDKHKIPYYVGSEGDILSRLFHTAKDSEADRIVRIWGDSPLIDPDLINTCIKVFDKRRYIYTVGFPSAVSAMSMQLLEKCYYEVTDSINREWIHRYMVSKYGLKIQGNSDIDLSVDTEEQFNKLERLINASKVLIG